MNTDVQRSKSIPLSFTEKICITLSIILILLMGGAVIWGIMIAPDKVPAHFNLKGEVDRYGDKWELLLFYVITIAVYISMVLSSKLTKKHFFSQDISHEKAIQLYKNDRYMRNLVGLETVILFLYIQWGTIPLLPGWKAGINSFIAFGMILIMCFTLFVFLKRSSEIKK